MKTVSAALKTHMAGPVTTLAICWRLDLSGGTVMGFTEHDRDIIYDGVTYAAASGFTPSAFEQSSGMAVDNLDVSGFLDAAGITEADIESGRLDGAEVRTFKINWADPSMGILKLTRGVIGEITRRDGLFVAEVRSLAQYLQQNIGRVYLGTCDAELGDVRCGVVLAAFTATGTVTSVTDRQVFADSGRTEADDWFTYGKLTWTSGNNDGRAMEVKVFSSGVFTLFQPMPETVQVGDTYSVYAGCDKSGRTGNAHCKNKFSNYLNFRGFEDIPGTDKMVQIE